MAKAALAHDSHLPSTRAKGLGLIVLVALLCLPSLVGAVALIVNTLFSRDISQWQQTSSALVALGLIVGGPLATLATVIGGISALSASVSAPAKRATLALVAAAMLSTILLLLRF